MAKEQPDRLHLWAQAASEWLGTRGRVAREGVRANEGYGFVTCFLATNPGLRDFEEDATKGIPNDDADGHARDLRAAERALIERLHAELAFRDTLQLWARRETARRGGSANLARALIEAQPKPGRFKSDREARAEYKAQLRKVEEWKQGKYTTPSGINRARVALLRGSLDQEAARLIEAPNARGMGVPVTLAVRGDWVAYRGDEPFTRKIAQDDEPGSAVHAVVADQGHGLIAAVHNAVALEALHKGEESDVELHQVYSLYVQLPLKGD